MIARDQYDQLREQLIASIHSDASAQAAIEEQINTPSFAESLVAVCYSYDFYSNDPRMEAAYFLSKCPVASLQAVAPKIEQLLTLPDDGETMNGNISFHLLACVKRLMTEANYVPTPEINTLLSA